MYCAISTACLYPLETEKSLAELLKLGYRDFEVFANCESEFSDEFIALLHSMLGPYDAKVHSLHLYTCGLEPFMFFSNYPRRFKDSLELYARYFEKAARLGAEVVVFHGDRRDSALPIEEFCERFDRLSQTALREGVVFAQENVARCRSATVKAVREMKRILGSRIHFVLDVKQALRAGQSPLEMCEAMGENISLVHISDSTKAKDCLLPGAGDFDFVQLCSRLSGFSYSGPLVIEVYSDCFKSSEELLAAREFMNKTVLGYSTAFD